MSELKTEEPLEDQEALPERRHLPPVLYPLLAAAFGVVLVWALSRILLAVSEIETVDFGGLELKGERVTAIIGLFVALNVLIGAALVAYGRRVRGRPASWPLLVGAFALLVAGGFVAQALEPGKAAGGGGERATTIALTASGIKFDQEELSMPAESRVIVDFANQDQGTPHNFSMYTDQSASEVLFSGPLVTGVATKKFEFMSPKAGTYFFRCDVHPQQMFGRVTVTEGAKALPPGGGGPQGGPVSLVATEFSFDQQQITVPAGGQVTIDFRNQGQQPHNFSVYTNQTAADAIFQGPITNPGATATYTFQAPDPGEYFFRCDVHPAQMTGTFVVQ
jgi:plastocyanin